MALDEMQYDDTLGSRHQQSSTEGLENVQMRHHAKTMLSLFGSTCICEQTWSLMTLNKNRLRSKMTDSHLRKEKNKT